MIAIPAGEFLYSDEEVERHLPEYRISKYPVTNGQYLEFAKDTGREWKSPTGRDTEYANHPATHVTWHDAVAYCQWLSEKAGKEYRLPTEEEWEKTARGMDGRGYPWGDKWVENKCNTHESGIGGTTPVGQFSPDGDSPYGCGDMAGNAWEWTSSWYNDEMTYRVLRGGSWYVDRSDARCAFRFRLVPGDFDGSVGFRVVSPGSDPGSGSGSCVSGFCLLSTLQ